MADIRDLQYLFMHFDVAQVLRGNADHLQTLISASPEHNPFLFEAHRCLLLIIEQLEEQ